MFIISNDPSLSRTLLNTDTELIGFGMGGMARAYFLGMFACNLCALQLICRTATKGQIDFVETAYAGIAIQFCELILTGVLQRYLGVIAIVPIFMTTIIILVVLSGLAPRRASLVGALYYLYHACSTVLLRFGVEKLGLNSLP